MNKQAEWVQRLDGHVPPLGKHAAMGRQRLTLMLIRNDRHSAGLGDVFARQGLQAGSI